MKIVVDWCLWKIDFRCTDKDKNCRNFANNLSILTSVEKTWSHWVTAKRRAILILKKIKIIASWKWLKGEGRREGIVSSTNKPFQCLTFQFLGERYDIISQLCYMIGNRQGSTCFICENRDRKYFCSWHNKILRKYNSFLHVRVRNSCIEIIIEIFILRIWVILSNN